jgi:hypothetical protein
MSITTIYHVSVETHEDVWLKFGHTNEYERKVLEATAGSVSSGQNAYSGVEEWAEFHTREDAEQCQKRLMDMGYYFAGKLCAN